LVRGVIVLEETTVTDPAPARKDRRRTGPGAAHPFNRETKNLRKINSGGHRPHGKEETNDG
jgi:hypothetical protein